MPSRTASVVFERVWQVVRALGPVGWLFVVSASYLIALAPSIGLFGDDGPYLFAVRHPTWTILNDWKVAAYGNWRPLTMMLYRLGNGLWGLNHGYALMAVAIHCLNASLVVMIVHRAFPSEGAPKRVPQVAWLGGLLTLLTAGGQEAVFHAANSADLMVGTFALLALATRQRALTLALIVAGSVAAKEIGVVLFPAVVCLAVLGTTRHPRSLLRLLGPAAIVWLAYIAWLAWRMSQPRVGASMYEVNPWTPRSITLALDGVGALFYPEAFKLFYGFLQHVAAFDTPMPRWLLWMGRLASIGACVGLAVVAAWPLRQRSPSIHNPAVALSAFVMAAGVMAMVSLREGDPTSRYIYVPAIMLSLLCGMAAARLIQFWREGKALRPLALLGVAAIVFFAGWQASYYSPRYPTIHYITRGPAEAVARLRRLYPLIYSHRLPPRSILILEGYPLRDIFVAARSQVTTWVGLAYFPTPSLEFFVTEDPASQAILASAGDNERPVFVLRWLDESACWHADPRNAAARAVLPEPQSIPYVEAELPFAP